MHLSVSRGVGAFISARPEGWPGRSGRVESPALGAELFQAGVI